MCNLSDLRIICLTQWGSLHWLEELLILTECEVRMENWNVLKRYICFLSNPDHARNQFNFWTRLAASNTILSWLKKIVKKVCLLIFLKYLGFNRNYCIWDYIFLTINTSFLHQVDKDNCSTYSISLTVTAAILILHIYSSSWFFCFWLQLQFAWSFSAVLSLSLSEIW